MHKLFGETKYLIVMIKLNLHICPMKKKWVHFYIGLTFLAFLCGFSLDTAAQNQKGPSGKEYRIMFYNTENLFDPFHDTLKNDHEFIAGGLRGWTWSKFLKKIKNISKVIIAAGEWEPPEIVAFSEVENRFVIMQLLKRTPLERFNYKIIHEESPDERGIDVAMIFRSDKFKYLYHKSIVVQLSDSIKTRSILYVKGQFLDPETGLSSDTLHLFINHWPSRTGGPLQTMHRRIKAAQTLKLYVDSLVKLSPDVKIVLTGDFNDEPFDESLATHLKAETDITKPGANLYNLMIPYLDKYDSGTNKYRNQWGLIDQFIVSKGFILNDRASFIADNSDTGSELTIVSAQILRFPFLLIVDEKYSGSVPFRTFNGMNYIGGFSDHLPILLTLRLR